VRPSAEAVAQSFRDACVEELAALKPGNVHAFSPGHGMTVADFEKSAAAAAGPLTQAGARVGRRIRDAVAATRDAVGANTNLGIILLCAPLAAAAERPGKLRDSLRMVLSELDREDAALAFEAIVMASPAGLGAAERFDVREAPRSTLLAAMAEAADRDRIARAYADAYEDIFALGLPAHEPSRPRTALRWWPTTAAYLAFLKTFPDSHIARKHGSEASEAVRREAEDFAGRIAGMSDSELLAALEGFDRSLKQRGLNPGTSADLTVATLFAGRLRSILREDRDSGSLGTSGAGAPPLSGQPVRRIAGC
jgi:triphosphoribosyl-dephospho-CoA synthase